VWADTADHRAGDLRDVREVVRGPAGEQLRERHRSEIRVTARAPEIFLSEIERVEPREVLAAEPLEFGEKIARAPARIDDEARLAIERRERLASPADRISSIRGIQSVTSPSVT
jgi:hypothetical protein